MLAKAGPNGDPIAAPSTCLKYLLLNIKKVSSVAILSKLQKSCFGMLPWSSLSLYKLLTQISIVSSKGILGNKKSTSRLAMCKFESCRQISWSKLNESVTVNPLAVEGVKNFSKNFANL